MGKIRKNLFSFLLLIIKDQALIYRQAYAYEDER